MFRVLSLVALGRVYLRNRVWKPAALLGIAAVLGTAGCGGGGSGGGGGSTTTPAGRLVSGAGFSFRSPEGWVATVKPTSAEAKRDAETLVSVVVLPLLRTYKPSLFPRVVVELDRNAATLATRLKGSVTARRTIVVAGGRARQYDLAHSGLIDRITFVLRGRREYQLTCRWRASDGEPAACAELASTFSVR